MSRFMIFEIDDSWLKPSNSNAAKLLPVFRDLLITRCEHRWDRHAFEYIAILVDGDPVEDGVGAERVDVIVTVDALSEITDVSFVTRDDKQWHPPEMEHPKRCLREQY